MGVSFTSSGLVTLDPGLARDLVAYDAFWQGPLVDREYRGQRTMSPAVVGNIRRGDPTGWVVGGPGQYPVDAVVTVAADDEGGLRGREERAGRGGRPDAEVGRVAVLSWQDCRAVGTRARQGSSRSGSGTASRSPGSAVSPRRRIATAPRGGGPGRSPIIATGEFVLGYDGEAGSYPDAGRPVPPGWMHDGSFQVVLRLRQDVAGWEAQMRELSASSGGTFDAAAKAIGRTADGKPLAARGKGGDSTTSTSRDQLGEQTPRFAHIRKMNPRNGTFDDRIHRVLRRGIPFATSLQVETRNCPAPRSRRERRRQVEHGLVFNAFMASIESQFEYLQRNWANNPDSLPPVAADGPDPVVGASDAPCVVRRGKADPVEIHFGRFVWTSGAVYAFAPSPRGARPARGDRLGPGRGRSRLTGRP